MGGTTEDRPRRARRDVARNREAILDAAALVLGRDPDASADEIAAQAGVNRATLYRHFATREALIAAMRDEASERGRALLADALEPMLTAEGRTVIDAIDDLIWAAVNDGSRFRRLILSDPRHGDEVAGQFAEIGEALFRRGQERGEIVPDIPAALLHRQLIGLVLATVAAVEDGSVSPEDAAAAMRRFVHALRP
ncbi:MAG: TetR/AcrR family transcriptional regulator [Solirubrobacteraceae bacterium]|nr:TetR/AcrR family transcriptional regulator [Solirubrobacteraceae bacterium]